MADKNDANNGAPNNEAGNQAAIDNAENALDSASISRIDGAILKLSERLDQWEQNHSNSAQGNSADSRLMESMIRELMAERKELLTLKTNASIQQQPPAQNPPQNRRSTDRNRRKDDGEGRPNQDQKPGAPEQQPGKVRKIFR